MLQWVPRHPKESVKEGRVEGGRPSHGADGSAQYAACRLLRCEHLGSCDTTFPSTFLTRPVVTATNSCNSCEELDMEQQGSHLDLLPCHSLS